MFAVSKSQDLPVQPECGLQIGGQEDKIEYHLPAKEPKIVDEPWLKVSEYERESLAKLVNLEAGGEPFDCKRMIVMVVFNRKFSSGKSIHDVIYERVNGALQFSCSEFLDSATPTDEDYEAVDSVLYDGVTIPSWVQYFRAGCHHNWSSRYVPYDVVGNTYFGGFKKEGDL